MKCLLLCAAVAITSSMAGEELRTLPLLRAGIIADGVGSANFAVADITGDGKPELISCAAGAPFAVGARDGTFQTVWHGPEVGCRAIAAGDRDRNGTVEILVVSQMDYSSVLLSFDPRTLGPARHSVPIPGEVATDVAIGNVDADGGIEIVVVNNSATHVFDGATLDIQWSATGYGGTDVEIGDVDGDARQEIVVDGAPGSVLDAANEVLKWGYVGGFGDSMVLGNVDADAKSEIVFGSRWSYSVTILHGDTFQSSSITVNDAIDSLGLGDANDDGVNEILTGNNQWGAIEGVSPSDGTVLWSIYNPEHGTMAVGAADIDGDGSPEVIWGAGATSSGDDALFFGDAETEAIEWRSVDLDGFFSSAAADLDGDGDIEYIVVSRSSESGYSGGIVEVFDLATGASQGTLPRTGHHDLDIYRLAVGQVDADPQLEILVLGEDWYDPTLLSWDGLTRQIEWFIETDGYNGSGFSSAALLLLNVDGDAVDEILVGTENGQLLVLNGASNIIQWSGPVGSMVALAAADLSGDGTAEVIVGTGTGISVLTTSNWTSLGSVALPALRDVTATAGVVAALTGGGYGESFLQTFTGSTLAPGWTCSLATQGLLLTAGAIDGVPYIVTADGVSDLRAYPIAGDTCPEPLQSAAGGTVNDLFFTDANGDGRGELLVSSNQSAEILLVALPTELRGDANADEALTTADTDRIVDYVFGAHTAMTETGDANSDGRIGVEDAFVLIHHFAGGAAPQP